MVSRKPCVRVSQGRLGCSDPDVVTNADSISRSCADAATCALLVSCSRRPDVVETKSSWPSSRSKGCPAIVLACRLPCGDCPALRTEEWQQGEKCCADSTSKLVSEYLFQRRRKERMLQLRYVIARSLGCQNESSELSRAWQQQTSTSIVGVCELTTRRILSHRSRTWHQEAALCGSCSAPDQALRRMNAATLPDANFLPVTNTGQMASSEH